MNANALHAIVSLAIAIFFGALAVQDYLSNQPRWIVADKQVNGCYVVQWSEDGEGHWCNGTSLRKWADLQAQCLNEAGLGPNWDAGLSTDEYNAIVEALCDVCVFDEPEAPHGT